MNGFQFGFFGCGSMGGALLTAVGKRVNASLIGVCDRDADKVASFEAAGIATASDAKTLAKCAVFLVIGVKPQGLEALFDEIRPILQERKDRFVLISMAAGTAIEKIEKLSGVAAPVIRIMPNTPVLYGKGMILYTCNEKISEGEVAEFLRSFEAAGIFDRTDEAHIDAGGALSGCGPAYVYLFAEAMADAGVECGLTRKQAQLYAAQTLSGAAEMLLRTGKTPGELKDAVCSPGGTTIAGVHALEEGCFRGTVMDAICAAFDKTEELKK